MKLHEAFIDPNLLGAAFQPPEDWQRHATLLKALEDPRAIESLGERELVKMCTGRERWREEFSAAREALLLIGRRGGKSRLCSGLGVGLATLRSWPNLAPGEQGVVAIIAPSQSQAKHDLRMARGIVEASPMLRARITRETATALEFGQTKLEVVTCAHRTLRGPTYVAVIAEELAHWHDSDTSSNPAAEVIRGVRPALASSGGLLIGITTPWARSGVVFDMCQRHYGKPSDVLVWKAPSTVMNHSEWLRAEIEREQQRDPINAATEYFCEWRSDVEEFLSRDTLEPCIVPGRGVVPFENGHRYVAFADASGGKSDSYAFAIAHPEQEESAGEKRVVLDLVLERKPPFDPRAVTRDFAAIAEQYGCTEVHADRYASGYAEGAWQDTGLQYVPSEFSASENYRTALPMFLARMVELPDEERLVSQLISLERHVTRTSRELITHPRTGHDDVAAAACGAIVTAGRRRRGDWEDLYGSASGGALGAAASGNALVDEAAGNARVVARVAGQLR
jgi:hypothetical protein